MKVAVVTPYYNELDNILTRCMSSVHHQLFLEPLKHIIVADTKKRIEETDLPMQSSQLINLNCNHNDAGATPRAIGAISAFSQGFDAVAFLDADNSYDRNHINTMVKICTETKADLVTATRNICSSFDNSLMYTDTIESNGVDFCDTNCLFVTRRLMHVMTQWITSKDLYLAGDRVFWNFICSNSNIKKSHSTTPTVNYYTKWAWHFQQAKIAIPDDSIWMNQDSTGKITVYKHKDRK